ncbi:patatin-like phospholipase family protein [Microvirga sp. BSC39]|uniref:patatin-like phospholipase family protein n=1 Tax=Microvirga sp. BSC39 TaxID=1549810 RepID=UPI000AF4070E|nr:patatin-like phospholipase family protein [Microvirga sp. BSC39]
MLKHVTPDTFRTDKSSDEAVISELERTGTAPEAITEQRLPDIVPARRRRIPKELGQIVLVLQGGGALGAYQVGAYQALQEAGVEPDWVIGTSIGAINASLIAGNAPEDRLERLREFWSRMQHEPWMELLGAWSPMGMLATNLTTIAHGIPAFFRPNPLAFLGLQVPLGSEAAGYYDTSPLARTLSELVDFDRINGRETRLTVGAANVRTSEMRYFDNRDMDLDVRHVMASGALPPAFPAVRIDGDLYWDGGILSNTPVEAVFDDNPRKNSVIFAVHIWNPQGPEPDTIWQVMSRQKDIQYSSRAVSHIARQKQIHRLRHVIAELVRRLPEKEQKSEAVRELAAYGCLTRMHVVRLLAPPFEGDDHTKDIDFSPRGIRRRWEAGYADTSRVMELAPWSGDFDPVEGFILHEARPGVMMTAA